jgi:hypothetical protein
LSYVLPRPRGVRVSRTRGGMRWLGRRVGDTAQLAFPAVEPRRPGVPAASHWGFTDFGKKGWSVAGLPEESPAAVVRRLTQDEMPERSDHRGRRSEDLRNTVRGTPWSSGGLAALTSTRLDVARHRGPWVRQDPRRPARPRFGAADGKLQFDEGLPGADIKNTGDDARLNRSRRPEVLARRASLEGPGPLHHGPSPFEARPVGRAPQGDGSTSPHLAQSKTIRITAKTGNSTAQDHSI